MKTRNLGIVLGVLAFFYGLAMANIVSPKPAEHTAAWWVYVLVGICGLAEGRLLYGIVRRELVDEDGGGTVYRIPPEMLAQMKLGVQVLTEVIPASAMRLSEFGGESVGKRHTAGIPGTADLRDAFNEKRHTIVFPGTADYRHYLNRQAARIVSWGKTDYTQEEIVDIKQDESPELLDNDGEKGV